MNILITAGGTGEDIDEVRRITNNATGRLASLVAREFCAQAKERGAELEKIYYVCEAGAAVPELPIVERVETRGVRGLKTALEGLLSGVRFDAVIHSMAVSDYCVAYAAPAGELAAGIARHITGRFPDGTGDEAALTAAVGEALSRLSAPKAGKLSSDIDNLMLSLRRTPKVIGVFKAMQPGAVLVGFKLLDGVDEDELFAAARKLMAKNGCDFVLCNDSKYFKEGRHLGFLLSQSGEAARCEGKEEIARTIAGSVLDKILKKGNK